MQLITIGSRGHHSVGRKKFRSGKEEINPTTHTFSPAYWIDRIARSFLPFQRDLAAGAFRAGSPRDTYSISSYSAV